MLLVVRGPKRRFGEDDQERRLFTGVSHFLTLDKPREFNETVLAFLKKNDLLKSEWDQ
jgi:pimeloyl-ACP methyl ester carboxylesterase